MSGLLTKLRVFGHLQRGLLFQYGWLRAWEVKPIDRNGNPAGTFASAVEPDDRALTALLEKLLADKPAAPKG